MKRWLNDIYWTGCWWVFRRLPVVLGISWLAITLLLSYECYVGNANDAIGYSRYSNHPETYKYFLVIWVGFSVFLATVIWIRRARGMGKQ